MPGLLDVTRWRFVVFGIIAAYGMLWLSDYLFPETQSALIRLYATTSIKWAVAFLVGGFVPGRGFLVPAVVSTILVVTGIILHTAFLFRQHDLPIIPIITNNMPILAITVAATAIGASIGIWFVGKARRQVEVT